jgi:TatD DNase family protein
MFNFHTHTDQSNAIVNLESIPTQQLVGHHYYSFGNHPWQIQFTIEEIEQTILNNPQIIAIGECGIDKIKSNASVSEQAIFLKQQILLSERLELPLILHIVNGYNEIIKLKKELKPKQDWIIHGFNKYKQTKALLDNDFYLSFGEPLLHNPKLQAALISYPLHKIILETDDSDLSIEKMYNFVADLKKISVIDLIIQIKSNLKTITNGKLA